MGKSENWFNLVPSAGAWPVNAWFPARIGCSGR
jgi:hypothetical protein